MKRLKLLILCGVLMLVNQHAQSQCSTSYQVENDCSFGDAIDAFTLNGVSTSGNSGCQSTSSPYGYVFFSSPVRTLNAGSSYSWSATVGGSGAYDEGVAIWIDLNANNIFESSEMLATSAPNTSHGGTISIPLTATPGTVRMRVRCSYDYTHSGADACVDYTGAFGGYGETEDYLVTITAPPCSGTPSPGNTLASANPICNTSGSSTLSLQNATAGTGITYQWQSSSNGTTWSNISGATSSTYSASPTTSTYYRCNVTCSGNTGVSNPLLLVSNFMGCYCIPLIGGSSSNGCNDDDILTNVTLGSLNNSTGCPGTQYPYTNFNGTVAAPALVIGSGYTLAATSKNIWPDNIVAWIDYNHSGTFDASEFVNLGTTNGNDVAQQLSTSITIPSTAVIGTTMMRVKLRYSTTQSSTSACDQSYTFGEVEDYAVEIVCNATVTGQPTDAVVCPGSSGSFSITATNTNTYQWQVSTDGGTNWSNVTNGGVYSNATTATLNITGATLSMNGYKYRCLAGNTANSCATASAAASLTIYNITGTTPGFACTGGAGSVSATSNAGTISWYDQASGGTLLGTGNTLNIVTAPGSNTNYYAQVAGCGTRTAVLLTVNSAASVSANPANSTICEHTNTSFSVTATNVASYQWQVSTNGGVSFTNITNNAIYSGATTATLNITGATAAMHGNQYRCELTTSCAVVSNSNAAILGVNAAPAVVTHPIDKTLCDGASFTLSAAGSGFGTLSYQWQLSTNGGTTWSNLSNGGIYSGVATNILSVSSTSTAMNGYRYRAVITGTCAPAANTNSALLTVNALPAVTGNPSSITICPGANTSFTCSGTGAALTYQWQVSTNGGTSFTNITNGGVYSNATTATLNITGATAGMTGYQYRCRISGTCTPNALTTAATLTVAGAPVVTSQPVDAIICTANSGILSVGASGFNLTYQWEESTDGGTTWSNVTNGGVYSGATTNSLMITTPVLAMNGNQYRCKVTSACAVTTTTNAITLTVGNSPVVTTHPTDKTVCDGGNTSYSVSASASAPIAYQWQGSADGISWTNILNAGIYTGATTSTLTLTGVYAGAWKMYRCELNTGCIPAVVSNVANLTITTPPVISINPVSVVKCVGENASFGVGATGSNLTYQWQISTNSGATWNNMSNGGGYSGVTTSNLAVTNAQASQNGYRFRCVVTGSCPSAQTSGSATLTVNTPVSVTVNPTTAITLCSGSNTSLTAGATGTGVTYRWHRNVNGTWTALNNGGIYSGVTTPTLNITNITATANTQTYIYQCRIGGTCNSTATTTSTITVHAKPTITGNPASLTKCDSTNNASFKVTATGTNISYQWQMNTGSGWNNMVNNSTYSGVTTATLLIPDVFYSLNGYQFRCVVSGTCTPAVTSGVATLTVTPLVTPSVTISASDEDICAGTNVTFTASPVNGGTSPTYVWKRGGSSVGTGSSYSSTTLTNNILVWVEMTSKAACPSPKVVVSNAIQMQVTPYSTPTIAITSDVGNTWCEGKPATFRATTTNEGPTPTYEWTINGLPVGANIDTYLTSQLMDGDKVQCKVTSSIMCPSPKTVSSNIITMTINPTTRSSIVIAANPDTIICAKKEVTMYTYFTNGGATPAFQWMLNGKDLPGETGGTLKINSLNSGDTINCRLISSATCVFPEISNPVVFNVIPLIDPSVTISMYYIGNETYRFVAIPANGGSNPSYQWYNNSVPIAGANAETYDAVGLTKGSKIHVEMVSSEPCVNPDYQSVSSRKIGTGIGELGNSFTALGLYPNPNSGQFNIKGSLDQPVTDKEVTVKITNALGQTVFTKAYTAGGTEINLPVELDRDLANGMYQVNVTIDGNVSNLRFILNR